MEFELFTSHAQMIDAAVVLHNVRLVDVREGQDQLELMQIEYHGVTHELATNRRWNPEYSRSSVGRWGHLLPQQGGSEVNFARGFVFRAYLDQTLRRVPALDVQVDHNAAHGQVPALIGWRCDARPRGFRAPIGLVPGAEGDFVSDGTVAVEVRVPPEFVREAQRVQLTAEQLLKSFIGDLAGISNFVARPRADGYGSNGSDERDLAEQWLERAHGMNAIDLDAQAAQAEEESDRSFQREELGELLEDYRASGGNVESLMETVRAMVAKQESSGSSE